MSTDKAGRPGYDFRGRPLPQERRRTCDHRDCCRYFLCAHPKCCGYAVMRYTPVRGDD